MKKTSKTFSQLAASGLMISLFTLAIACKPAPAPTASFDLAAAKTEIEDANKLFANLLSKDDSVGIATECYTADAKLMVSNMPVIEGRKNIQSAWSSFIKTGLKTGEFNTIEVWGNENALTEEGTFLFKSADGKMAEKGKYLVLWKKEDGTWKLFRDCSNSDLPHTAAE